MSGFELVRDIRAAYEFLDVLRREERSQGLAMNAAEAKYYTVSALRVLELREEGYAAAIIDKIIKGEPKVNDALNEWRDRQVEYKAANEAIQCEKRHIDFLIEQYKREWTKAGEYEH